MKLYIPDDLLYLSDATSMAHSLEMRVPFLDHKIVEFFWKIPSSLKLKGLNKKYLLKKAAERYLPKEVIYRKKKGFSVPLTIWFRNELQEHINNYLNKDEINKIGFLNYEYISSILEEHNSLKANHDEKIFLLLAFVIWHKEFIQ
jgi:asparagine synthase (glutamine-hydrolysing)